MTIHRNPIEVKATEALTNLVGRLAGHGIGCRVEVRAGPGSRSRTPARLDPVLVVPTRAGRPVAWVCLDRRSGLFLVTTCSHEEPRAIRPERYGEVVELLRAELDRAREHED